MFNNIFNLGGLVGIYSGSPLTGAVINSVSEPVSKAGSVAGLVVALVFGLLALALLVFLIVAQWKLYKKAGRPGWAAIIPIYNTVVLLQIVDLSPWLVLLAFIPFVGSLIFFIVSIFMNIRLAKAFGKDGGFAVGLILLPVVFVPILAFGQAKFIGLTPASPVTSSGPVPPQNPPAPPVSPAAPQNPTV